MLQKLIPLSKILLQAFNNAKIIFASNTKTILKITYLQYLIVQNLKDPFWLNGHKCWSVLFCKSIKLIKRKIKALSIPTKAPQNIFINSKAIVKEAKFIRSCGHYKDPTHIRGRNIFIRTFLSRRKKISPESLNAGPPI